MGLADGTPMGRVTTDAEVVDGSVGRTVRAVRSVRDQPAERFRRRFVLVALPFGAAVGANAAIGASSLGRTARAVVSAPFGLAATISGLALGVLVLGRYVRIGPLGYRIVAAVSAVLLAFIMFTGSLVRLTGSGLGCPDWPTCKGGEVIPKSGRAADIEFGNRVVTGLCILAAAGCVLLALVRVPYRQDLVRLGFIVSVLIFGNAIVGGMVVLFHLKTGVVTAHFVLAIASLTVGLLLFHRAREEQESDFLGLRRKVIVSPRLHACLRAVTGLALVGLFLGAIVTGSGPHGGDPAKIERYPFDLEAVTKVHSSVMWLLVLAVVISSVFAMRDGRAACVRRRLTWLILALIGQGTIGYVQWAKHLPAALVQLHVIGAVVVWTLLVWVRAAVTSASTVE